MLNQDGYVAECTGDNIFMTRKGVLMTPALHNGMLEGVTRNEVLAIAEKIGIKTRESTLTRFDLFIADEVFLTGTAAELIPVVKIDNRTIGSGKPGPIFNRLLKEFREIVKEPEALIFK